MVSAVHRFKYIYVKKCSSRTSSICELIGLHLHRPIILSFMVRPGFLRWLVLKSTIIDLNIDLVVLIDVAAMYNEYALLLSNCKAKSLSQNVGAAVPALHNGHSRGVK